MEAKHDYLIEQFIIDSRYIIKRSSKIFTIITRTGKISVNGVWRETGLRKSRAGYNRVTYRGKDLLLNRIIYIKFKGKLNKALVVNHKDENSFDFTSRNNSWKKKIFKRT
jgi:hypothetical protein